MMVVLTLPEDTLRHLLVQVSQIAFNWDSTVLGDFEMSKWKHVLVIQCDFMISFVHICSLFTFIQKRKRQRLPGVFLPWFSPCRGLVSAQGQCRHPDFGVQQRGEFGGPRPLGVPRERAHHGAQCGETHQHLPQNLAKGTSSTTYGFQPVGEKGQQLVIRWVFRISLNCENVQIIRGPEGPCNQQYWVFEGNKKVEKAIKF